MTNSRKSTKPTVSVSALEAIYRRRSVRDYAPRTISGSVVRSLLDAATQALTAMHEEPWAFAIIQDRDLLDRLSESARDRVRREARRSKNRQARHALDLVNRPDFHVFYNAGTLIVIYGKADGPYVVADCWLAAENLMLAACAKGLGTCVIGFAVSALNSPEWRAELKIPVEMTALAPLIVGVPVGETPRVSRKQPGILTWR